jgi:hypothetical protein
LTHCCGELSMKTLEVRNLFGRCRLEHIIERSCSEFRGLLLKLLALFFVQLHSRRELAHGETLLGGRFDPSFSLSSAIINHLLVERYNNSPRDFLCAERHKVSTGRR